MDLSRIPEPMRSRIQEQLERLPPEVRVTLEGKLAKLPMNQLEAVLQRTSPLLEKLGKGHGSAGGGSAGGASAHRAKSSAAGNVPATGSTTGQAPRASVFDPHNHYNNTIHRGDGDSPPFFVILFVVACALVFARTLGWFDF